MNYFELQNKVKKWQGNASRLKKLWQSNEGLSAGPIPEGLVAKIILWCLCDFKSGSGYVLPQARGNVSGTEDTLTFQRFVSEIYLRLLNNVFDYFSQKIDCSPVCPEIIAQMHALTSNYTIVFEEESQLFHALLFLRTVHAPNHASKKQFDIPEINKLKRVLVGCSCRFLNDSSDMGVLWGYVLHSLNKSKNRFFLPCYLEHPAKTVCLWLRVVTHVECQETKAAAKKFFGFCFDELKKQRKFSLYPGLHNILLTILAFVSDCKIENGYMVFGIDFYGPLLAKIQHFCIQSMGSSAVSGPDKNLKIFLFHALLCMQELEPEGSANIESMVTQCESGDLPLMAGGMGSNPLDTVALWYAVNKKAQLDKTTKGELSYYWANVRKLLVFLRKDKNDNSKDYIVILQHWLSKLDGGAEQLNEIGGLQMFPASRTFSLGRPSAPTVEVNVR